MATSDVQIVNVALTLLGQSRITSIDDDVKQAREAKAIYDVVRDALLANYNWSFAMTRIALPASATPPIFEFRNSFPFPVDCLRVVFVGDFYVGLDMTDYRGAPNKDFMIEGRNILANFPAPLNVRYIKRVVDPTQFHASFVQAFASSLARDLAEPLTQSGSKRDRAESKLKTDVSLAVRANAIELPPESLADDPWVISRL